MLDGVEQISRQTVVLINDIKQLMQSQKETMRRELPKVYSQDLLNNLFSHPYVKIEFVMEVLQIHRNTATKYLDEMVRIGMLQKYKLGKENFYLNHSLFALLLNVSARRAEHAQEKAISCE